MELRVSIEFRDQMPHDLDRLDWTGGPAHLDALTEANERALAGQVVQLVGELPTGELIASGAADLDRTPAHLWMLTVHPSWRSLGVGTGLVRALEERLRDLGEPEADLTVEHDNPRARALYERLGYRATDESRVTSWPTDDGARHVTLTTRMVKRLA